MFQDNIYFTTFYIKKTYATLYNSALTDYYSYIFSMALHGLIIVLLLVQFFRVLFWLLVQGPLLKEEALAVVSFSSA